MPSAIWERLRPATFDAEVPYVAAEEVIDTYSGPLCTVGEVPPGVFTLSGKVTEAPETGKPIAGVLITLDTKTATTNQDGNYSFANLEAKTYHIVFGKEGYNSVTRNIVISKDTVLNIQLTTTAAVEEKKFPWWILGVAGGSLALIAIAATQKKK